MTIDRYRLNHWSTRPKKAKPMINVDVLVLVGCIIAVLSLVSFSIGYQYGQADCQYLSWRPQ